MEANSTEPIKMMLVGGPGVGKTCIINRINNSFPDGQFPEKYVGTNEITSVVCEVSDIEGKKVKLELFDSPGQETYYKEFMKVDAWMDIKVFIGVYDVMN